MKEKVKRKFFLLERLWKRWQHLFVLALKKKKICALSRNYILFEFK